MSEPAGRQGSEQDPHVPAPSLWPVGFAVGVVGILVSRWVITESRDTSHEQSIDLPGLVTSGGSLLALSYALIEGNKHGWGSPEIIGLFVGAAVLLAIFIVLELRQRLPMLDLELFKIGSFAGANIVAMLVSLGMFGVFFFISIYMQNVRGYSAVRAGATFLPMTLLIIFLAPVAGRFSDRLGSRGLMAGGMTLTGVSLLLFARLEPHSSFWVILPALVVGGAGMAITMTPMTNRMRDVLRSALRSANQISRSTNAVAVIRFVAFDSTRIAPTGR